MAKKNDRCPFCDKNTLEPFDAVGHGWLKCSSCGATHQPNPTKVGVSDFALEPSEEKYSPPTLRPRKRRTPRAKAKAVSGKV